jgi:hypothetical protein
MDAKQHSDLPLPDRNFKRGQFAIVAILLVCFVAVGIFLAIRPRESPAERFKGQVREAVPVGASREQAIAWAEQMGAREPVKEYDMSAVAGESRRFMPEVAGLPRNDLKLFVEVRIPWGSYRVWRNGEVAANVMWVFIPLDEGGRVTGHYFLTLEELAEHERVTMQAKQK